MNNINEEEIEYRINSLLQKKSKFSGKKIAIYGTGINAKIVLDKLDEENILCLIDPVHNGEYFYGKKVLPREELLLLGIEVIIIAAIPSSAFVVEERITEFCLRNKIILLDMYGIDVIQRKQSIIEAEIGYSELKPETVFEKMLDCDAICIAIEGVFFEKIKNEDEHTYFYRKTVIDQVNQIFEHGKKVYLLNNSNLSKDDLEGFLVKANLVNDSIFLMNSNWHLDDGAFRIGLGDDFEKKVLFISCKYDFLTMMAYDYGLDVIIFKETKTMIKEFHKAHLNSEFIVNNSEPEVARDLFERYESPYYSDFKDYLIHKTELKRNNDKNKCILVISKVIPKFDCDTGSKSIYQYIKLFIEHGYNVVFLPGSFEKNEYATHFEKMGVKLLIGEANQNFYQEWILRHKAEIEFAFVAFPECGFQFADFLNLCGISIVYYGIDLHYVRKKREYEISGDEKHLIESSRYYNIEKKLINLAEVVFYPSPEEVDTIKEEFDVKAHYLRVLFYEKKYVGNYKAKERDGIMFVGGYGHQPNVDAVKWFVSEIFPEIRKQHDVTFYIVGSREPEELRKIQYPGIVHVGYVSDEELENMYSRIRMVVIPLRYGAGVKGKVVDAMYRGIPIVSTNIGIEGIPGAEEFVTVSDDSKTFASSVNGLYENYDYLEEISEKSKEYTWENFSKDKVWDLFEKNVFG